MKKLKALIILSIIIGFISCVYYISDSIVEEFLFMDKQRATLPVNKNMLKYSTLLPDDDAKQHYTNEVKQRLGVSDEMMLKNLIKYDNKLYSLWIDESKDQKNIIDDICHYVSKSLTKKMKVLFYKLNKYKHSKSSDAFLLDTDYVFYNGLHSKIVCMVDINNFGSKQIQFFSIKVIGTISEDKLWQSEENDIIEDEQFIENRADVVDNNIDALMYSDSCASMKTQDQQAHSVLYSRLMYIPDKASLDNILYMENQNKIRQMFLQKLQKRTRKLNNCYKNYPYKNDFNMP